MHKFACSILLGLIFCLALGTHIASAQTAEEFATISAGIRLNDSSKKTNTMRQIEQGLLEISNLRGALYEKGVQAIEVAKYEESLLNSLRTVAQATHRQENMSVIWDIFSQNQINSNFVQSLANFQNTVANIYIQNGIEDQGQNYKDGAAAQAALASQVQQGNYPQPVRDSAVNLEPSGTVGSSKPAATTCTWKAGSGPDAGKYCLLAPLGDLLGGESGRIDIVNGGMAAYLEGMFRAGIAIATGLTLIMIVIGGLQYVSTDAWGGKSEGKEKITQALLGLLLALGTVLIVQELNPTLLRRDLDLNEKITLQRISGPNVENLGGDLQYVPDSGVLQNSVNLIDPARIGITGNPNLNVAGRIVESARKNIGFDTCLVVTENGRKGCGYAFGKIMKDAGVDIGLSDTAVLGTRAIYNALASSNKFYLVPGGLFTSVAGDIVISPTGEKSGHVGIVETMAGSSIISNSSAAGEVSRNWTATRWISYYEGTQGLKTYVFRAKI